MRTKKVLLIVLVLVGMTLGTARVTQAAFSDCYSGRVCMWGNNDFQWLIGNRSAGYGVVNLYGDANNQMESWANRTGTHAAGYDGFDGYSNCQTFSKGGNDNNVAPWKADDVSSWRTDRGC